MTSCFNFKSCFLCFYFYVMSNGQRSATLGYEALILCLFSNLQKIHKTSFSSNSSHPWLQGMIRNLKIEWTTKFYTSSIKWIFINLYCLISITYKWLLKPRTFIWYIFTLFAMDTHWLDHYNQNHILSKSSKNCKFTHFSFLILHKPEDLCQIPKLPDKNHLIRLAITIAGNIDKINPWRYYLTSLICSIPV